MIYDKPLARQKRPIAGSGDSDYSQIESVKAPDISSDVAAIDRALALATKRAAAPKQSTSTCGCSRCGPHRRCPDHPGCDGRG